MTEPWMNRAAVQAYARLVEGTERVLEFGAGSSTLWLDRMGCDVTTYEHHERWATTIRANVSDNVTLIHEDAYHLHAREHLTGQKFDIIVIDGEWREECLWVILDLELLAEGATLILDDSQREEDRSDIARAVRVIEASAVSTIRYWRPNDSHYGRWESLFAQF